MQGLPSREELRSRDIEYLRVCLCLKNIRASQTFYKPGVVENHASQTHPLRHLLCGCRLIVIQRALPPSLDQGTRRSSGGTLVYAERDSSSSGRFFHLKNSPVRDARMSSGSHRASAYFLTQTSSTMRDKQWRKRCGSEAKRGKGRARERSPITWDSDAEEGGTGGTSGGKGRLWPPQAAPSPPPRPGATRRTSRRRPRPPRTCRWRTLAQGHDHCDGRGGPQESGDGAHDSQAPRKAAGIREGARTGAKLASGRPPLAERKTALTALKLQQLERAQAQQARRLGMMDASVRSSGRKSGGSRASTSRTTSRASLQSGRTSGRVPSSARSRCGSARSSRSRGRSTARGDETCRSDASWSSKLSIDSQASNLTEKAMSRIIELERALERERKLREMAEQRLTVVSMPSSRASSEAGRGSTARSSASK